MAKHDARTSRPVHWIGNSQDDLRQFPEEVTREIGYALWFAQVGDKHPSAKPLKGFKGAGVLEIVENHDGESRLKLAKSEYQRSRMETEND